METQIDPDAAGDLSQAPWSAFPTEFRGCVFEDGWEFGSPSVIYFPPEYTAYSSNGSNTGEIEQMVYNICEDLACGRPHNDGGIARECEWRGWSRRGFSRRKSAWHIILKVEWQHSKHGPVATVVSRTECYGMPNTERGSSSDFVTG